MGLFADRKLIEIRIASGKPGKDGSEALQRYAEQCTGGEDVVTLVHLPRLDRQQSQSAWFTALDRAGVSIRVDPIDRNALPQWIAGRLRAQGHQLPPGEDGTQALTFFADRVEGNLLAAHQELQKLALLFPPGELSFEQLRQSVMDVARFDVFKFGAAVLAGQAARSLRMLDGLRAEGETPVLVHWTLADDIRALHRCKAATQDGKPLPMALREARVWGEKERLFERVVPGLDMTELDGLLAAASTCDGLVKGLRERDWPAEPWDALRRLVLMMLDAVRAAGRRGAAAGTLALTA